MAQGNQAANQAAKRGTLQNNDLILVATLVPQTKMPETSSYTEGRLLKLRLRAFKKIIGCVSKGGTPFSVWDPPMEVG